MGMDTKPSPFQEMGVSGLQRTKGSSGIVFEEWFAGLSGYRQRQVYREMRDNDAGIGAMAFALEMILRRADWNVEAANKSKQAHQYAQFVDECVDDMSHPWEDLIAEAVTMLWFGFAAFETVYKRRLGPQTRKPSSKFNDGLIGWRKMAPRAQESVLYWDWDEDGGLQGLWQLAAPDYILTPIPIGSLLLFRTTSNKNNPEGRSVLRNCFRPWTFKKRLEEVIGIGIERDVCGLPVLYLSDDALRSMGNGDAKTGMSRAERFVTNIRQDDQQGLILPAAYDENGHRQAELILLKAAGAKQTDPEAAIKRHNQEMFNTILAGFIEFGQVERGSHSLHMSATQIFAKAVGAFMDAIAAAVNRHAITRLMSMNNMDLELAPKLKPGEIDVRDLEEIGSFILKCSQAGFSFQDPNTQGWARKLAGMPEEAGSDQPGLESSLEQDDPDESADSPTGPGAQEEDQAGDRLAAAV